MAGLAGLALGMLILLGVDPGIGAVRALETGTTGRRSLREVLPEGKGMHRQDSRRLLLEHQENELNVSSS